MQCQKSTSRGSSRALPGRVPISKEIQGFIPIFHKRKLGWIHNKEDFEIFDENHPKLGWLAPRFLLRTSAWHPLSNFSGCLGTRGTRTAAAPDNYASFVILVVFESTFGSLNWLHMTLAELIIESTLSFVVEGPKLTTHDLCSGEIWKTIKFCSWGPKLTTNNLCYCKILKTI